MAFQEKAWCDEPIMDMWIRQLWKPACSGDMLLIFDVHKAKKTDAILDSLDGCNTTPVYVPPASSSPLTSHSTNPSSLKWRNWQMSTCSRTCMEAYVRGDINASERRILFTKWVGEAWERQAAKKEMVTRSVKKCGIAVAIDDCKIGWGQLQT